MLKEALQLIQETAVTAATTNPIFTNAEGHEFVAANEGRLQRLMPQHPEPLSATTLAAVKGYLMTDECLEKNGCLVSVTHQTCLVYGPLDKTNRRPLLLKSTVLSPSHKWGQWLDLETFNVWLLTGFVLDEAAQEVLRITGNIIGEFVRAEGDDGMSTSVEVRQGVAAKERVGLGPILRLKPFCTWPEIEPVSRPFVIRLRDDGGIRVALFEGQDAWEAVAGQAAAEWLEEEVGEVATIIA
jgi:hypothetical protein